VIDPLLPAHAQMGTRVFGHPSLSTDTSDRGRVVNGLQKLRKVAGEIDVRADETELARHILHAVRIAAGAAGIVLRTSLFP
jgi:hypothetical protein